MSHWKLATLAGIAALATAFQPGLAKADDIRVNVSPAVAQTTDGSLTHGATVQQVGWGRGGFGIGIGGRRGGIYIGHGGYYGGGFGYYAPRRYYGGWGSYYHSPYYYGGYGYPTYYAAPYPYYGGYYSSPSYMYYGW